MAEAERINTEKASIAITQALQDLEQVEESERFTVSMMVWMEIALQEDDGTLVGVSPYQYATLSTAQKEAAVCQVCLGGAVLANRYNDMELPQADGTNTPSAIQDDDERNFILAMDGIRQGDADEVLEALDSMDVESHAAHDAVETTLRATGALGPFDEFDPMNAHFDTYEQSPEKFKRQRRVLAAELAAKGY